MGPFVSLSGRGIRSKVLNKLPPLYHAASFSQVSLFIFSPLKPSIGTKEYELKPQLLTKNGSSVSTISVYLFYAQLQVSILVIITTTCYTPKALAS